jgi:hypothetical protein
MSTLTGQAIKDTYEGLLKLEDSTAGITSSYQQIQDGLGNNTGLQIKQNGLFGGGVLSYNQLQPQFMGSGYILTNGVQYGAGTQNTIIATPFYDNGIYSYSAITTYTATITSTSDTVEYAIYSAQIINPFGLYPYQQIVSGITASTTSTGAKTFVLPSNISMSGTGAGVYFLVYKISNSGVQPTYRPGGVSSIANLTNTSPLAYGPLLTLSNVYSIAQTIRGNNAVSNILSFSGLSTFDSTYSNTINTLQSSNASLSGQAAGLLLHVVGA